MQDKIDFSSLERIVPKEDSFGKVLNRLESQRNKVSWTRYSRVALAASLVFILSGLFLPKFLSAKVYDADTSANFFELEEESFVFEFDTLDSTLSVTYLLMEDK